MTNSQKHCQWLDCFRMALFVQQVQDIIENPSRFIIREQRRGLKMAGFTISCEVQKEEVEDIKYKPWTMREKDVPDWQDLREQHKTVAEQVEADWETRQALVLRQWELLTKTESGQKEHHIASLDSKDHISKGPGTHGHQRLWCCFTFLLELKAHYHFLHLGTIDSSQVTRSKFSWVSLGCIEVYLKLPVTRGEIFLTVFETMNLYLKNIAFILLAESSLLWM